MIEDRPYVIMTYKRVWKIERVIYKLDKYKLPRPVSIWQILYFVMAVVVVIIIDTNTPFLSWLSGSVRYLVIPGGIAFYLSKAKHDGKAPHRWIIANLLYEFEPKRLNRYRSVDKLGKQRYEGLCTFRELYTIDKRR